MRLQQIAVSADLTIAGAGMSGICAAVQAVRLGLRVALVEAGGCLGRKEW